MPGRPRLLVIRHAPWEGPHRILAACDALEVAECRPFDGEALPAHADVAGAVLMGGPMNVDDRSAYPALADEVDWVGEAVRSGMPVLGVCLGAQLIARALEAEVRPGPEPEIGFHPVQVTDPADPVIGSLAPSTTVLHWHGDVFDLPEGATPLASSARTEHQAFRFADAWALLFHPEADAELVESWLAVPEMAAEAEAALGADFAVELRRQARAAEADLVGRSTPGFRAFAELVATP